MRLFCSRCYTLADRIIGIIKGIAGTGSASGEDCLNLDVKRPVGTTKDSKLPVMLWLFPGAFVFGSASTYSGDKLIARSVEMNQGTLIITIDSFILSV